MQSKVLNSFFQKFFLVLLKTTDNGHFFTKSDWVQCSQFTAHRHCVRD